MGYRVMVAAESKESTARRRPVWGDVSDLVRILDVQPDGERAYVSVTRDAESQHRGVVEGSQMLAQSIVAAMRQTGGRRVVHASMVFMRVANTTDPLRIELDALSDGRTFSTLAPRVQQNGKLCASGVMLLDAGARDVMRHEAEPPEAPDPEATPAFDMGVTGRDVRFVDDAYTGDPDAPVGPPWIDAWLRYRDLPDDPALHAALLAHFTGHVSIAAAMRPHAGIGQGQAHRTLSTAINAINIAFHAEVKADRFMLYRHRSTFAGDGMTHSECRVHDQGGGLLASFTVDAMVRGFAEDRAAPDPRKAL